MRLSAHRTNPESWAAGPRYQAVRLYQHPSRKPSRSPQEGWLGDGTGTMPAANLEWLATVRACDSMGLARHQGPLRRTWGGLRDQGEPPSPPENPFL